MCKKPLQRGKAVEEARTWAADLVAQEARGNGDTENAMRRLEQRYGIPWRTFWSLRYRPPTSLCADIFVALYAARRTMQEQQLRKLRHELTITQTIAGPDAPSVAAAAALVDAVEGEMAGEED